tara:strand:+ start:948 stop:1097 length:150 start_codon:yes stop_codon:yes gene_type:complete
MEISIQLHLKSAVLPKYDLGHTQCEPKIKPLVFVVYLDIEFYGQVYENK